MLEIGDTAPDFTLPTDSVGDISLSQFKGKNLVLFFYPKDNTPGCTTEAKEFSIMLDEFKLYNCEIVGISADSIRRHSNFREKHDLKIILASNENHDILTAYDVWQLKKNYGKEYMGIVRSTFLLDENGKIVDIWRKVRVKSHVEIVLNRLKTI